MRRPAAQGASVTEALRRAQRRTGLEFEPRLRTLLTALGAEHPGGTVEDLLRSARAALGGLAPDRVWLALAVLTGRFPVPDELQSTLRAARLDGPDVILADAATRTTAESARRTMSVVTEATVVDLGDLVSSPLGTGIQRVARNVTREWLDTHGPTVVAWTSRFDATRPVAAAELSRALGRSADVTHRTPDDEQVVVPWHCTYLLPELAVEPPRCAAQQAMARAKANRTVVVGFDCVPVTSPETSAAGFANVFALHLAATAHVDQVAAISQAAATEYEGWRRMLAGAGLSGPRIDAVPLPAEAPEPDEASLAEARRRFVVPGLPMVLVVGSHEPRKNHVAVLHAAELAWRSGLRFTLSFVGGNAWGGSHFRDELDRLAAAGHPVESVIRLPDRMLWAAYRLARFTVFPSLNEGFGLPVAESLAAGTPVLTSAFGSMREIALDGGAVMVDPRNDREMATALHTLLTDDALIARLREQARSRPRRTWPDYAEDVWRVAHQTPTG